MSIIFFFNLFLFSPLEQFEISSYNTSILYNTTFPIEFFENNFYLNYNPQTFYNIIDLIVIYIILKGFQLFIKQDGFIFLYIFILVLFTCINFFSFTNFIIAQNVISIEHLLTPEILLEPYSWPYKDVPAMAYSDPRIVMYAMLEFMEFVEKQGYSITPTPGCKTGQCGLPEIPDTLKYHPSENLFNNLKIAGYLFNSYNFRFEYVFDHGGFNEMFMILNEASFDKYLTHFTYITTNTSFINMYTVFFCFVFIYLIIYLLFNKSLSKNSTYLIPQFYTMIGENIFKITLNLFVSVLGKHLSHPEFFIKINTIFLFLIISNVQGMIPYMSTLTSALTNTFFIALALFISIILTLLDKKGINYFLNLFMPSGCPIFLILLLIPIEIISYSFRVVSLSVRLFANMMAGHTLLKVIVGFSWVIVFLGNTSLINLFPIIILFILTLLEFGVALIQAYIFTILSCIYLRDIFQGH